ncbi:MAG TPA: AbrB/MazE/SpoVT family DNA-binding domain-containing protein [Thermoanaerobaculia bacterium]|jgi:AbrB family looped-hinge helix DNA binding protein|nr:AbrB/MazE/SpoVT family DNA-binding domain-containing protein [Thermoanaerobaculia bacterium]
MNKETVLVTVGEQGRLVIPAAIRRKMHLSSGETLVAFVEDNRLVLERRSAILERLKARFAGIGVSLADELIAERRAEAAKEDD